jgi:hypothetical protein
MEPDNAFSFQPDRAISEIEADRLDRALFVKSLVGTLVKRDGQGATGVTVGLVGRWGAVISTAFLVWGAGVTTQGQKNAAYASLYGKLIAVGAPA